MGHFVIHNHGSPGASKSISTYLHVFIMALNFYLLELDVSVFRLPTTAQTAMRASKTEYTKCGVGIFVIFSSVLPIRLVVDFRFCIFHVIWGNSLKQLQYITYPNPFSSCDTCKYYTAIVFSCFFFNLITELGSQSEWEVAFDFIKLPHRNKATCWRACNSILRTEADNFKPCLQFSTLSTSRISSPYQTECVIMTLVSGVVDQNLLIKDCCMLTELLTRITRFDTFMDNLSVIYNRVKILLIYSATNLSGDVNILHVFCVKSIYSEKLGNNVFCIF